uniref:Uncharacterized protein n=1 Tax=Aegilops tauschii TaxID=37682 RepID=N1QSP0_AEGTA
MAPSSSPAASSGSRRRSTRRGPKNGTVTTTIITSVFLTLPGALGPRTLLLRIDTPAASVQFARVFLVSWCGDQIDTRDPEEA